MTREFQDYEAKVEPPYEKRPFAVFEIKPQSNNVDSAATITGEIYRPDVQSPTPYYAIRWPTSADVRTFLTTIGELSIPTEKIQPKEQELVNVDEVEDREFDKYWEEGILIYTDIAAVWCSLDVGLKDVQALAPDAIQRKLATLLGVDTPITVQHYRINTPIGDFYFDLIPDDDEIEKYAGVLSWVDLSNEITELAISTGNLRIDPSILPNKLESVLGDFPNRNIV